jgi:integrase
MVSLDISLSLRRGELAGLRWEDLNFDSLTVSVTRLSISAWESARQKYRRS